MAKSKYFERKKKDDVLPVGEVTLETASDEEVPLEETPVPVEQKAVSNKRIAYDAYYDRTERSYKMVVIEYDNEGNTTITTEDLGKNQALAVTSIQRIFAMKFIKRT